MPVMSNASPFILFAKIGHFKEVIFRGAYPTRVGKEVTRRKAPSITPRIREGWIKVEDVELSSEVKGIGEKLGLHEGVMYTLSLALHTIIKEVLVDDELARVAARILGLRAIGCLGIVMKMYETGIIRRSEAVNTLQKLVKAGLWISPEVAGEVLTSMEI